MIMIIQTQELNNTPEMPKNDKSKQVLIKSQLKDGSQGQNDGDNTSNNDQPIHNSNKKWQNCQRQQSKNGNWSVIHK
nr:hypothetical protein [Mycoplasmopsis bovis]